MKSISKQGQQFMGHRFVAPSLHQVLKSTGTKNYPANSRRLRRRFTGASSSQKKLVLVGKYSGSAKIAQPGKSLAETHSISHTNRNSFDERALSVNKSPLNVAEISGMVPLDHPLVMVYISSCQQDNRMIYVSPQIASLGFMPEMWLGKSELRLQQVHEDDRDRLVQALQHSRSTGDKFNCLYRLYDSNGEVRWLHDEASVALDESGSPLFIRGVMLDITDKKNMEAELKGHRYYLEQHIESRTGQLVKRVALLESCNASLCDKLALANKELARLKNQTAGQTIPSNRLAPTIQDEATDDCIEQLDGISEWARNMIGWRVSAAGTIA